MTKARKKLAKDESGILYIKSQKDESQQATMSRAMVEPNLRHGILISDFAKKMVGELPGKPRFDQFGKAIKGKAAKILDGDLSEASQVLTAQALSLDMMFTELARRSAMNLGDYPLAAERYARLAFKAQTNSRAAFETLAKLHQPREQIVRHVHVNEGGQAVVAENFHAHTGGAKNAKSDEQSHATGTTGQSEAMLGQDAERNGVPIPSCKGAEEVQDARRDQSRRT